MAVNYLFLDFDGPLITWPEIAKKRRPAIPDPLAIAALNYVLATTDAQIVISSAWRVGTELAKLERMLAHDWKVRGRVVGKTPRLTCPQHPAGCRRGEEIYDFLRYVDDGSKFVIIDDEDDMFPLSRNLVKVDRMIGMTMEDADAAIQILGS